MQTYTERSTQLALDASIAVQVLVNEQCDSMEFLMVKPRQMSESELAELKTRWAGRGLKSVGVVGWCGTKARCVLKEDVPESVLGVIGVAFVEYMRAAIGQSFVEQLAAELKQRDAEALKQAGDFVQWALALWSLKDARPN